MMVVVMRVQVHVGGYCMGWREMSQGEVVFLWRWFYNLALYFMDN
jgi:hypothetical protein